MVFFKDIYLWLGTQGSQGEACLVDLDRLLDQPGEMTETECLIQATRTVMGYIFGRLGGQSVWHAGGLLCKPGADAAFAITFMKMCRQDKVAGKVIHAVGWPISGLTRGACSGAEIPSTAGHLALDLALPQAEGYERYCYRCLLRLHRRWSPKRLSPGQVRTLYKQSGMRVSELEQYQLDDDSWRDDRLRKQRERRAGKEHS